MASLVVWTPPLTIDDRWYNDSSLQIGPIRIDDDLVSRPMRGMFRYGGNLADTFPVIVDLGRCFAEGLPVEIGGGEQRTAGSVDIKPWPTSFPSPSSFEKGFDGCFVIAVGTVVRVLMINPCHSPV